MYIIDERIDKKRLEQFASYLATVPKQKIDALNIFFEGKENIDYYYGMLAGFAYACETAQNTFDKEKEQHFGCLVAYISKKILDMENVKPVSKFAVNLTGKVHDRSR